jgi:rRNA small subunit pseudouridine methyltransferase Nep1
VQLLHKLKIRSADSNDYLLRVIRNPVTDHLPAGSLRIGTSVQGTLVDVHELAERIGGGQKAGAGLTAPIVFCVGSHSTGPATVDWTEQTVSISQYPLSASVALGRITNAFERVWQIL